MFGFSISILKWRWIFKWDATWAHLGVSGAFTSETVVCTRLSLQNIKVLLWDTIVKTRILNVLVGRQAGRQAGAKNLEIIA